jgi:hypothetical protein
MNSSRRSFLKKTTAVGAAASLSSLPFSLLGKPQNTPIKIGIIGLDTSHSPAFTKLFNAENPKPELAGFRVVAAYPYGSKTIQSSMDRIPGYIEQVKELGVEIVDSIETLLQKVDVVLLETNDGKPHLEQARAVFKAKKPVFIDKHVAGSFSDALKIYKEAGFPCFLLLPFATKRMSMQSGMQTKLEKSFPVMLSVLPRLSQAILTCSGMGFME